MFPRTAQHDIGTEQWSFDDIDTVQLKWLLSSQSR